MRATKAVTKKQAAIATGILRLQAALRPNPDVARVKRDNRILFGLAPAILLPFAGAALIAMHPPKFPEAGAEPVAWLDVGFAGLVALMIVGAFVWSANRTMAAWGDSAPATPEAAVREFYRVASTGHGHAHRLGLLLAPFDVVASRVQPVFHWLTAGAIASLDSAKDVAKYWRALVRGNKEVVRRVRVKSVTLQQPVADVEIAMVALMVVVTRRVQAAIAAFVGCAIALTPFFVGVPRVEILGVSFWTAVAAASALGVAVCWILRKALRAVAERKEVSVRKIVVRQSHNWRLLSGEWESQDEANLAWFDPAQLK